MNIWTTGPWKGEARDGIVSTPHVESCDPCYTIVFKPLWPTTAGKKSAPMREWIEHGLLYTLVYYSKS